MMTKNSKVQTVEVRCGQRLNVKFNGIAFTLNEPCLAGHPIDTEVQWLLGACMKCVHQVAQPKPVTVAAAAQAPIALPVIPIEPPRYDGAHPSAKQDEASVAPVAAIIAAASETAPLIPELPAPLPVIEPIQKSEYSETAKPIDIMASFGIPEDESSVDVDGILKSMPDYAGGPSSGGISAHTLLDCQCWRKAYYKHVLGARSTKSNRALQMGTLYHDVMARRYTRADTMWNGLDHVAQMGAPKLAGEVRKIVEMQLALFAREEWETWCPRAVEQNITAHFDVKVGSKTVRVPICGRTDMILALKKADEAHPGPGPVPQGVYVVDHKTASQLTYDLTTGYGLDFQFMLYMSIFLQGGYTEVYGPLNGIFLNLVRTTGKVPGADSFLRPRIPYSPGAVEEFIKYDRGFLPTAGELYTRLSTPEIVQDINAWPKDLRMCQQKWRCDFFDVCDGKSIETAVGFTCDPKRALCIADMEKAPKAAAKISRAEKAAAKAADPKNAKHAELLKNFGIALSEQIANVEELAELRKENFLTPGHTLESVVKLLAPALKKFYAQWIADRFSHNVDEKTRLTFQGSGVHWTYEELAGNMTWKQVAESICQNNWFDVSNALPEAVISE